MRIKVGGVAKPEKIFFSNFDFSTDKVPCLGMVGGGILYKIISNFSNMTEDCTYNNA